MFERLGHAKDSTIQKFSFMNKSKKVITKQTIIIYNL